MTGAVRLSQLTTEQLSAILSANKTVALVPVGSTEPHGPHLPLATDVIISEGACLLAAERLGQRGVRALVAPSVGYGVTDFARGFAGAVGVPREALTAFVAAVCGSLLSGGFAHVCLVNNHLEPAHDEAVRAAAAAHGGRVSVACPLSRRWGRTLSAEFKSGACHAGRYETSLVMAVEPSLVDDARASALAPLSLSLSDGIRRGIGTFAELGMENAYTGAPAEATAAEGRDLLSLLADMVTTEVTEHLAAQG